MGLECHCVGGSQTLNLIIKPKLKFLGGKVLELGMQG